MTDFGNSARFGGNRGCGTWTNRLSTIMSRNNRHGGKRLALGRLFEGIERRVRADRSHVQNGLWDSWYRRIAE